MPKSRCDLCDRRIWPSRYELGLCPRCETLVGFYRAQLMVMAMARLVNDPGFIERVRSQSTGIAAALQAAMGE